MKREHSACGVGLIAGRTGKSTHDYLSRALTALERVEHRGACGADGISSDGAGIMADIPFDILGYRPGEVAVATLFVNSQPHRRRAALKCLETTLSFLDLDIIDYRPVPICVGVLGPQARDDLPYIVQVIIRRPKALRTNESFNAYLYFAKQTVRSKLREINAFQDLYFTSLSTTTVVYKALTTASDLRRFYPDLSDPKFTTRFALFHRRFSTNTRTSWDRAQPFRLVAHNGEINTITGNLSWSYSREQALGLKPDELLTHENTSDSGNLNEQVEALRYRSSMPNLEDILAIMIPPADTQNAYYDFWGRAMEPWDGPAFITYSDGETVGARLDRNGFRPCRWARTEDGFYLASEAGVFDLDESKIEAKGTLNAGRGVRVCLETGTIHFRDPSQSRENMGANFEARLIELPRSKPSVDSTFLAKAHMFGITRDEVQRSIVPMAISGKEPIGSMGDTAQLALFSDQRRSLFDFFFQNFAQVTNPPLDYVRERVVTELNTLIGRQPNIFAPKELLPPTSAFTVPSPLLDDGQLSFLTSLDGSDDHMHGLRAQVLSSVFRRSEGTSDLETSLRRLADEAINAAKKGVCILVLSDRCSSEEQAPVPSLLALRAVVNALNRAGLRLETSVIVDAGDIRSTHHFACAIGFGATAVCPYLAWAIAQYAPDRSADGLTPMKRSEQFRTAMENGLLKIMSKVGISSVRSYRSSKLFTPLGLSHNLVNEYFPGLISPVGGLDLTDLAERVLSWTGSTASSYPDSLPLVHRFKEHSRGLEGERHAMTAHRARLIHDLVKLDDPQARDEVYERYVSLGHPGEPTRLSHLLEVRPSENALHVDEVESVREITRRFGSGAMSFGALSAEAQRDIFRAMAEVGGRSNSGEGGENPYYFVDGTRATTKQVASGRFGVTAEYLISGEEIEIKMAQGAKPGEGGQLMGVKVDEHIARARHSIPGVDLISPPPLHDIYSIEDLKELIYELRQLHPLTRICVKLVAGANIGNIAVGVVKAGADIIQISGGDGGTGAATLSSMMHAGLPWELGIIEVHQTLLENGLRQRVTLRVDGGLHTGLDLVIATLLGAQEFGFGKMLLVAQGCIMARVCEKNRCPRGIATQSPKFKDKYRGSSEDIVKLLDTVAQEVRRHLAAMGVHTLSELVGQSYRYLRPRAQHRELVRRHQLDLTAFLHGSPQSLWGQNEGQTKHDRTVNSLNQTIVDTVMRRLASDQPIELSYPICSTQRAVPATLSGVLATRTHQRRMDTLNGTPCYDQLTEKEGRITLSFTGSAGQGFAAFTVGGLDIRLRGEANDSVAKSMSGGQVIITPSPDAHFIAEQQVIIGNCALYGATGGTLMVHGIAGDRFAVRNSGAVAIAEGAGLHLCEYMTSGEVIILGAVSHNVGAGMTGGRVYLPAHQVDKINEGDCQWRSIAPVERLRIHEYLTRYIEYTGSKTAKWYLQGDNLDSLVCCLPLRESTLERLAS